MAFTLGLGVITRNKDATGLKMALESVKGMVDAIYITVADKEPPDANIEAVAKQYGAHLSQFQWCNDFSAARNFNMAQVKEDWFTWLDTDDEVDGMEKAKKFLETLPAHIKQVMCTYNYAFSPTGRVDTSHPKERFMRNDGSFKWKGRLHESCVADFKMDAVKCETIVWNHRTTPERSRESSLRNVAIIEEEVKTCLENEAWNEEHQKEIVDGKLEAKRKVDPKDLFSLGMAFSSVNDWNNSIAAFLNYLKRGEWNVHHYMAWKYIGIAQMNLERADLALVSFFRALELQPGYRDAYTMLGSAYQRLGDKDKAKEWYTLALLKPSGVNEYAWDAATSVVTPLISLATIYGEEGKIKDAEKFLKEAKNYVGDKHEYVNEMEKAIYDIKKLLKGVDGWIKKLEKLTTDDYKKLMFQDIPNEMKSHPTLVAWRRKQNWKTSTNGHEVTIFTGISWEEWNPDSIKTGIGGSEEAVINMAKELKLLGYDVTVYGRHGVEAKEYDGVWYRPFWEWSPTDACDIFIGWRDPKYFDAAINAKKKYLWLHDTVNELAITSGERLKNIDRIMVLSKFHRSLYPGIAESKFVYTNNGIDPKHFQIEGIERKQNLALYTSAPDRGLEALLTLWPEVRKRVPNATLKWCYGWQTYDAIQKNNPNGRILKEKIVGLLKQPGVEDMGRIGHEELAKLMLSAGAWAYPTEFPEINCITAQKMQAAGCIPVCTNIAALDETVQFGWKVQAKDIYSNKEAQNEFVDQLVLMLNGSYPERKRAEMREWAITTRSWACTAKQWDNEFKKSYV